MTASDRQGRKPSIRYPLAPFFALTGWTMSDVAEVAPCSGQEWRKRRDEGVTERIADRIAVAAGLAAVNVWPELLDDQIAACSKVCDECGEGFVPSHKARKDARFCSRNCNKRFHYRKRYREALAEQERDRARRYYDENRSYVLAQKRREYRLRKGAA